MIRQSYADFVGAFGDLNPFELDHLSEALMVKLEEVLADKEENPEIQFSLQDINYAMTRAMRDILVELAETQIADAQSQLEKAHSLTFKPRRIVDIDAQNNARKVNSPTIRSANQSKS